VMNTPYNDCSLIAIDVDDQDL